MLWFIHRRADRQSQTGLTDCPLKTEYGEPDRFRSMR